MSEPCCAPHAAKHFTNVTSLGAHSPLQAGVIRPVEQGALRLGAGRWPPEQQHLRGNPGWPHPEPVTTGLSGGSRSCSSPTGPRPCSAKETSFQSLPNWSEPPVTRS